MNDQLLNLQETLMAAKALCYHLETDTTKPGDDPETRERIGSTVALLSDQIEKALDISYSFEGFAMEK